MIENYVAFLNRSGFFLHLLVVGIYCTSFTNLKFRLDLWQQFERLFQFNQKVWNH
jgi:hypothetical protein